MHTIYLPDRGGEGGREREREGQKKTQQTINLNPFEDVKGLTKSLLSLDNYNIYNYRGFLERMNNQKLCEVYNTRENQKTANCWRQKTQYMI